MCIHKSSIMANCSTTKVKTTALCADNFHCVTGHGCLGDSFDILEINNNMIWRKLTDIKISIKTISILKHTHSMIICTIINVVLQYQYIYIQVCI